MTGRVSNTQILTALEGLPAAIAAAMAPTAPVAVATPADQPKAESDTVSVDKAYLSHVSAKLQDRSNTDRNTYVLYARINKAGETKLAYCVADKWSSLTDKRIVGAMSTIAPE